ncbi:uncharacterized protein LOC113517560 [Galleria mellonella]|uniref:Uncharacterized protein LOC113517560 n=1 Tax=Galleria mellonella TaxID=7137 RepID=A0A6J1WYD2_GALME|nr:uncharacterized protein LOC113517560 [Galleria mellonella]
MSLKVVAETKINSEPCVIAWDNKLFVGTDDGSIKSFNADLSPAVAWAAHGVQIFAIAAHNGNVYSSSNDGGIRVWSAEGEKITELQAADADIGTLRVFDNGLYAGDENGNVIVFENNKEIARYNVLEEVKDLWLYSPFLFTVRDLDVTVTEIKPDESRTRFVTRHTMEGSAPLRVTGSHLLVMARGGNVLKLHDATSQTKFKQLHEVKVSDMIVTSLSVYGEYTFTGGWDGYVRRWKIAEDQLVAAGELNLESCINAIVATDNCAYVILSGGRIVSVKTV